MTVPPGSAQSAVRTVQTELGRACRSLELRLVDVLADEEPANGRPADRPGLERALERLEGGEVSCLIVPQLEHLSRRVDGLAALIDRLERAGIRLVALDVGLDTASSTGRMALERRPVTPADDVYADEAAEEVAVTRAIGYATMPAETEGDVAALEDQVRTIEQRCTDPALDLVDVIRERQVEGPPLDRPGFSHVMERIAAEEASCVIVASLGALSPAVAELGKIVDMLDKKGIRLIVAELDIDTAVSGGRLTVRALASVASWEHDKLSERTRKGVAAAQSKRIAADEGTGLGQDSTWPEVSRRIAAMRASGMTLQAIADALNADGVPTPRGGAKWRPSSVQTAAGYKRRSRAKRP
jgi:DNA invertase Pin-like site-specific DNA recombinase